MDPSLELPKYVFSHYLPIHLLQPFDTSHLKQIRPAHVVSINPTRRGYSKYPCKPLFLPFQTIQLLLNQYNCWRQSITSHPFDEINPSRPVERESATATQLPCLLLVGNQMLCICPRSTAQAPFNPRKPSHLKTFGLNLSCCVLHRSSSHRHE